ncbi:hypothetical protein DFP73DRAFT_370702 [Morchella snyderi]|nr:hypothetical protein DFP73DRAFT_370702 [Morchella snyderi]
MVVPNLQAWAGMDWRTYQCLSSCRRTWRCLTRFVTDVKSCKELACAATISGDTQQEGTDDTEQEGTDDSQQEGADDTQEGTDDTQQEEETDLESLKMWVDHCYVYIFYLLTKSHDFLHQPSLGEGVWEGIYWTIVDMSFTSLPEIMIQRRDTILNALDSELEPVVDIRHRFDGIIRTRDLPRISRTLEFGVIEVSRQYSGDTATKWNSDMKKLYAACRSILNDLKTVVNHHPPTMKQLAAVGILQAGPYTMVLVMRCLGHNLFFLRRGGQWKIPTLAEEVPQFRRVLSAVWLARAYVKSTFAAVSHYRNNRPDHAANSISPSDTSFL